MSFKSRIEFGDCRETMRRWASEGVKAQMCVTSPPYFGLRDYGHEGQIGLEQTPAQYITAMVEVFRCVRDVLSDDGTLWLNIGDSYASGGKQQMGRRDERPEYLEKRAERFNTGREKALTGGNLESYRSVDFGVKPKDLIGIPWMLAFALRADGWYLRQDIIWHKPNPMPESVRDRCTKAHEYIFLLSKSERYFFDSEAMKEPAVKGAAGSDFHTGKTAEHQLGRASSKPRTSGNKTHKYVEAYESGNEDHRLKSGFVKCADTPWETRNRRSVWTVATRPYKGAHFATFPPALIEPCILAGSRPGDIVLDPFMGSGTTAAVSLQHGRSYLGCELNPEYGPLQQQRIDAERNLFT
jgi:DNA modification methylase